VTVLLLCAALAAGYLLGSHQVPARAYDAAEDWADRRTGRVTRWAVQPVYALLILVAFIAHPVRVVRNVRASRKEAQR